jgi:hypothetical protein
MKRSLPFLILTLCASAALAQTPTALSTATQKAVTALVQDQLLKPLHRVQSKRSRFSRVASMPLERRVRVLDAGVYIDTRGKSFVRFAIDTRDARDDHGAWDNDSFFGCAYPDDQKVFVQSGDDFLPAASMLGGSQTPRPFVCRVAPVAQAQLAVAPL